MRIVLNVVGVLVVWAGVEWFLQGIGLLPGSFMTGQTRWAIYGAFAVIGGAVLLIKFGNRRIAINVVAVLLLLMGTVWLLQGINVLPGSFMTGQPKWAVYGAIADLVGAGLLVTNGRGRAAHRS
jgi:hypothetical protein